MAASQGGPPAPVAPTRRQQLAAAAARGMTDAQLEAVTCCRSAGYYFFSFDSGRFGYGRESAHRVPLAADLIYKPPQVMTDSEFAALLISTQVVCPNNKIPTTFSSSSSSSNHIICLLVEDELCHRKQT
jgi:hypothetical protein